MKFLNNNNKTSNEIKLIELLFSILDEIEFNFPDLRDTTLLSLSNIYKKDNVDTVNCYLNYTWNEIDNVNNNSMIENYVI